MINNNLIIGWLLDELAIVMMALVAYVGLCVSSFASRYMQGDSRYQQFFIYLTLLIVSVGVMVTTDHLGILLLASCLSHFFLVLLMIHKTPWKAAKASGALAAKNYLCSVSLLIVAFATLYWDTREISIHAIMNLPLNPIIEFALVLMLIAAMMQSALWPFHRWLLSSLNSPTPVSALMHAGLINGGGFLLARFAPLYLQDTLLLQLIFFLGLTTALLGTLWKLMQHDVKRMLACSTMGQMGFMFLQCGLGLFPAAVAHLIWHGMFKAYLFLASGSAAQEKRLDLGYPPTPLVFTYALICGLIGSLSFACASDKPWLAHDTQIVLVVIAFIAASQAALAVLREKNSLSFVLAMGVTAIAGCAYGLSVRLISELMAPMNIMQAQPITFLHIMGTCLLLISWLAVLFIRNPQEIMQKSTWMRKNYVKALNASQPHPSTITAHRKHYRYQ